VGYVDVYRNGVYLPTSDYTATTGTTVVLTNAATVGDTITTISFYVSSVLNAIPATAASINSSYLASGVARANWGAGGVLQVVNATYATAQTTTSTSYQASGLAVSITPSSSTSKILITGNVPYDVYGGSGNQASLTMYRGATNLMTNGFAIIASGSSNELQAGSMAVNWLDSPATTSATTYTIYFRANSGGGTARIFVDNYTGSLTAMEIAA
jgi:hypothetical protein